MNWLFSTRLGKLVTVAAAGAAMLMFALWVDSSGDDGTEPVTINELFALVTTGDVVEAELDDMDRTVTVTLADGETVSTGYPVLYGGTLIDRLETAGVEVTAKPSSAPGPWFTVFTALLPIVLIGALILVALRRFSGSKFKTGHGANLADHVTTTFVDVAGADEAVDDLADIVAYLTDPDQFEQIGAASPRGVLLVGPPGTGKTLLARAVAGEADVPFYYLSGSDFVEMFVGVGAARVRDVFRQARKSQRAIIFIDELDSIGKKRGSTGNIANEERETTLNALLVEMDGFDEQHTVVVIAATNRPEILDPALLRPGRFDRHIPIGVPDRKGRAALIRLYLGQIRLDPTIDVEVVTAMLARRTHAMTGADIKQLVNEAALIAVKAGVGSVSDRHLEQALERGVLGRERISAEVSEQARTITAWHEAGHAVAAMTQPVTGRTPERVSIIPRGHAGGATWLAAPDDEHFVTRTAVHESLVVTFAGRAAEELLLDGDFTQGAAGDIEQATARAKQMVCEWGMSPLGLIRIADTDTAVSDKVHVEVTAILGDALDAARTGLRTHYPLLQQVAAALLEHDSLTRDQLDEIAQRHSPTPTR